LPYYLKLYALARGKFPLALLLAEAKTNNELAPI
jgi:hypothetical protein